MRLINQANACETMLTDLREKSQSFLIYIAIGILILVFIFFFGPQAEGIQPGVVTRNLSNWAAEVHGEEISQREIEISVRRQALFNQDFDDDAKALAALRKEITEQVVDQTLLEQRARGMGMAIGEKSLSRYILSDKNPDYPLFQDRDGRFNPKSYRDQLQQLLGATPEAYRRAKSREVVVKRYLDFLSSLVKVGPGEVQTLFDRKNTSWNLEYVVIDPAKSSYTTRRATPEEVATYEKQNGKAIEEYYEKNKALYVRDKEIQVRRVLIKKPEGEDKVTAARARAAGLLKNAQSGTVDFAALATAESEGYYKNNGGDMGWQTKSNTAAEDYAVYAKLKVGEISALQDTSIGFWFVKAEAVKEAKNQTLDELRSPIATILQNLAFRTEIAEKKAQLVLDSLIQGNDFPTAAAHLAPPTPNEAKQDASTARPDLIKTTGTIRADRPVWQRIPGIGESRELAGDLEGLTTKAPLLKKIVKAGGKQYIVRLKSRTNPDPNAFEAEREGLEKQLRNQRVSQLFGNWQAMLYGPAKQREIYRKFGAGALISGLDSKTGVRINPEAFALPQSP